MKRTTKDTKGQNTQKLETGNWKLETAFGACGRKEDLISYLYDEANAEERGSFERHLDDCPSCRDEIKSFARVRDDLRAWEVGFTPRAEIVLPRSFSNSWRELIGFFPVWARGAALTMVALSLLLFAFSSVKNGYAANSERVEALVKAEVARERARMEQDYSAQLAGYREQLKAENEKQLNALLGRQEAQLEAVKAQWRKFNRQNSSFRSFFAMDDADDTAGDNR